MEDDVGRDLVGARALQAPLLERGVGRVVGLLGARLPHRRRRGLDAELEQEAARHTCPGEREVALRPRHADVEQAPFLVERARHAQRLLARQLLLLDARQEDRVELEPLRAMERQQVDATLGAVVEPGPKPLDPLLDRLRAVVELLRQLAQPREVRLPHELALAEAVRNRLDEPQLRRDPPHLVRNRSEARAPEPLQEPSGRVAREQRRALERDLRVGEQLFEVDRAGVQSDQHGHPLVRHALGGELPDSREHELAFLRRRLEAAQHRLRPARPRRPQRLLRSAQPRHQTIRQREHLRRRAVVLLQPHHRRLRVARGQPEQPLGRGAGEAVDRLVVVADRAELVAVAEPELEQRLLEQVHVLVLVDRERAEALAQGGQRPLVLLVHPHRLLEEILEVDQAGSLLSLLVLAEDTRHQVGRDRRLVRTEAAPVALRRQTPVLGPLDLGREIARGPEAVWLRQRVADLAQEQRLGREDSTRPLAASPHELRERGRVEGPRLDAVHAEPLEPAAHLARGLVGEGDRKDLVRAERARGDLLRDPASDRRRLAGARARQDADRPAHGLGRPPLLRVQPLENHRATLAARVDGTSSASDPKVCLLLRAAREPRAGAARASSRRAARPGPASLLRARAAPARPAHRAARPRRRSGR